MSGLKFIAAALLLTLLSIPSTGFALKKGEQFPTLSGKTLTGEKFDINSLNGHPVLLKVGTTWCPTCEQQSKEIDKLRSFLATNQIKFIEVFIQENAKKVRTFLDKNDHQLPDIVIIDQGKIARALNIYLIPRIILINKDFQVYRDGDPLPSDALKQELLEMLTEK